MVLLPCRLGGGGGCGCCCGGGGGGLSRPFWIVSRAVGLAPSSRIVSASMVLYSAAVAPAACRSRSHGAPAASCRGHGLLGLASLCRRLSAGDSRVAEVRQEKHTVLSVGGHAAGPATSWAGKGGGGGGQGPSCRQSHRHRRSASGPGRQSIAPDIAKLRAPRPRSRQSAWTAAPCSAVGAQSAAPASGAAPTLHRTLGPCCTRRGCAGHLCALSLKLQG